MEISIENRQFFPPPCIAQAEGVPLGIRYRHRGQKKLEWWGYQKVETVLR